MCEHSEIGFILAIQNIVTPHPSRFARHLLPQEKAGKNPCFRQRVYWIHARATHFSAGVQTMRARICSAISCAMFARVVWLKSWGAAKSPAFALPRVARTCHAWLARLTRARGRCFLRGWKILLNDFWYFSSLKSTENFQKEIPIFLSISSA